MPSACIRFQRLDEPRRGRDAGQIDALSEVVTMEAEEGWS